MLKKMKITNVQGDVIFKKIDESMLPKGKVERSSEDLQEGILAYGELQGYRHQLMDQTAFEAFNILNNVYVRVFKDVQLKHGKGKSLDKTVDHQTQTIKPGLYKIEGAMETDWVSRTERRVVD